MHEINAAAEWYFRRNCAETMVVNAADYDIDDDGGFNEASSGEEDSDETEDSDYESYRRQRREKKEKKRSKKEKEKEKTITRKTPSSSSNSSENTIKPTGNAGEVADLIRHLNKMTLDDTEYAPTYYSILALDTTGHVVNCINPPKLQGNWKNNNNRPPQPATPGNPPRTTFNASSPATYPNNIPLSDRPETPAPDTGCFGCGKEGHRASECPEIKELERAGVVKIDNETRRVKLSNGSFIRRAPGENIVQAVRRLTAPRVMLGITDTAFTGAYYGYPEDFEQTAHIENIESDSNNEPSEMEEDESAGELYITIPKSRWHTKGKSVHGADRTETRLKTARRLAFDGVHVPRHETTKDLKIPSMAPPPAKKTEKTTAGQLRDILSDVQPIDARKPRFAEEQDIEMKDIPIERSVRRKGSENKVPDDPHTDARQNKKPQESKIAEEGSTETKPAGRHSEVQSTMNLPSIVERILNLELPMTVREALAASKEIRNGLQEVVRLKNVKAVLMGSDFPVVANFKWPRQDGVLIRIELEVGGRRVVAIVDTGSQLDIVWADVAALTLHKPMDMTCVTGMNDANGGRGELRGFIHEVELPCGGVITKTGLWVSQQAPFELLLGRPWQRNNLVSIDEREEGTYLVFKDRETRLPRYELMAVPHEATTEVLTCGVVPHSLAYITEGDDEQILTTRNEFGHCSLVNEEFRKPEKISLATKIDYTIVTEYPIYTSNTEKAMNNERLQEIRIELDTSPPPELRLPEISSTTFKPSSTTYAAADKVIAQASAERSTFGAPDGTCFGRIHEKLHDVAHEQRDAHIAGHELRKRPASLTTNQAAYLGSFSAPTGEEVHRAVFLNAEMQVYDPATGEMGSLPRHAYAQLHTKLTDGSGRGPPIVPHVGSASTERLDSKTPMPGKLRLPTDMQDDTVLRFTADVDPDFSLMFPYPTLATHPVVVEDAPFSVKSLEYWSYPAVSNAYKIQHDVELEITQERTRDPRRARPDTPTPNLPLVLYHGPPMSLLPTIVEEGEISGEVVGIDPQYVCAARNAH
ncbi:hypothetical protein C8R45DRAFT_1088510 [Mycena sanguinolenta]|nr:hypothetical protein C8R45DRAFT_1088510 [Mycena sanguinolenta]